MVSVFVSYALPDLAFARHLARDLYRSSLTVYGRDLPNPHKISQYDVVLLIVSYKAVTSSLVKRELEMAVASNTPIIPLLREIDSFLIYRHFPEYVRLPANVLVSKTAHFNLSRQYHAELERLCRRLKQTAQMNDTAKPASV